MKEPLKICVPEFIADTTHLTAEEIGQYLLILMAMHQASSTGWYRWPNNPEELSRIARGKVGDRVLDFFNEVEDGYLSSLDARHWQNNKVKQYIPASVRHEVWNRDGQCCQYCGCIEGPFHLDHVVPVTKGGKNEVENLRAQKT